MFRDDSRTHFCSEVRWARTHSDISLLSESTSASGDSTVSQVAWTELRWSPKLAQKASKSLREGVFALVLLTFVGAAIVLALLLMRTPTPTTGLSTLGYRTTIPQTDATEDWMIPNITGKNCNLLHKSFPRNTFIRMAFRRCMVKSVISE